MIRDPYEPGGKPLRVPIVDPRTIPAGRVLTPPKGLTTVDLWHISEWPANLTEFDDRRGVVLFHDDPDPRKSFHVGFTYAQIRWHRSQSRGSPLNFRRLVAAALASTRISHEQGGGRVKRTWRSPTSVYIQRP